MNKINTIVIGSLNTDLIVSGANKLLSPGEMTSAKEFVISPGGKSRNIAVMVATLSGSGDSIAFISKTVKDKLGLWEYPVNSLIELGIDISYVEILENHPRYKFPGLAVIPVDKNGQNQIYLIPGIREDFLKDDINKAEELFKKVGGNGVCCLTLEMPVETALEALKMAKQFDLRTFIDPGGVEGSSELIEAVSFGGYLIKPNEYEAKTITGINVIDFSSAQKAASKLRDLDYEYVVITHGAQGAYAFGKDIEKHFPAPKIDISNGDSIGCGDQSMAALIYSLGINRTMEEAVGMSVIAGTLEHTKNSVIPVTKEELERYF